jgi:hypothetical protein
MESMTLRDVIVQRLKVDKDEGYELIRFNYLLGKGIVEILDYITSPDSWLDEISRQKLSEMIAPYV